MEMKKYQYIVLFLLLVGLGATGVKAQEAKYLPVSEHMSASRRQPCSNPQRTASDHPGVGGLNNTSHYPEDAFMRI